MWRSIHWNRISHSVTPTTIQRMIQTVIQMATRGMMQTAARNSRLGMIGIIFTLMLALPFWAIGILPAAATGVYSMPSLTAGDPTWVIDQADVVSRITESDLAKSLQSLQSQTGAEVRFVTVYRMDYGETIQTFVDKLFEQWFPTEAEQANQIVIAIDDLTKTSAIHVGTGLTERLSVEMATSVAQDTLLAPLRQGDRYNQAFTDAKDRLTAILSGEPDPGPPVIKTAAVESTFTKAEETDAQSATTIVIVLLVLATVIPMATYYLYVR